MLVFIGGVLFSSVPENSEALLAARYLNGIAVGLGTVPFLVYASEIAADSYRGKCLCMEQYYLSLGITVQMIYANFGTSMNFSTCRLHGIVDILVAILAMISLIYFVESPIDQIRQGNDGAAMDSLARLLRPEGNSAEIYDMLEERTAYVREQLDVSVAKSIYNGLVPLLKMILFRSMMLAFCYSLPLNDAIRISLAEGHRNWVPAAAACCRGVGSIIVIFLMDHVDRKPASLISMAALGGLLIGFASLFQNLTDFGEILAHKTTAVYIYMLMQLALGFFGPFTSVYAGEAFPLRVKPYFVGICVIVEQVLQIVLIYTEMSNFGTSLMAQGILILLVFFALCLSMPETRNVTLSEAQRRFRKVLNLNPNL